MVFGLGGSGTVGNRVERRSKRAAVEGSGFRVGIGSAGDGKHPKKLVLVRWVVALLMRTWRVATLWAAWSPMGLGWGWDSTMARASVRTVLYSTS